jgi:ATP-dependent RNA helicase DDX18/HAS1
MDKKNKKKSFSENKEKPNKKEKISLQEKNEKIENNNINNINESNKINNIKNNQDDYFSDKKFSDFSINSSILSNLERLGYEKATQVQSESIPIALNGEDIIGSAKTGSGKSLAFLIPAIQKVYEEPKKKEIEILIITPTRELALQLYDLAKDLLTGNSEIIALLIGGENRKKEALKLLSGNIRIIVATPGRLLDHMENTKNFDYSKINMLIIDEADKILKIGFEEEIKEIIKKIPKNRQTLLFSATITPKVEDLITLSVKEYKNIHIKNTDDPSVSTLEQGFINIEADKKFLFLFTFIKKNLNRKIIIFFSTCKEVEFFSNLLNYVDVPVLSISGDYKQQKRSTTFIEFCSLEKGVLLCTDVAQRGLDIPDIDWVIQYDPPHDPEEYLHRVGRTARGANKIGKALLMILPNEIGFIRLLQLYKIKIEEFEFPENKLAKIQEQYEKLVNKKDHYLLNLATEAYRAYLHAYNTNNDKDNFNIEKLDLIKLCKSFGLLSPPFVHLNIKFSTNSSRRKNNRKREEFLNYKRNKINNESSNNNDNRQFIM